MFKLNQKGVIDPLVTILLILVLAMGGYIGWTVFKSDEEQNTETTQEKQEPTEAKQDEQVVEDSVPEGWLQYKNDQEKFSFIYPEEWNLKDDTFDDPSSHLIVSATLVSPDYDESTGSQAYGGSNVGSRVYISVTDIENLKAAYTSTESILNGTAESKMLITEVEEINMSDNKAVRYISSYEGPAQMISKFEKNGKEYSIVLEQDVDGPENFNDNVDVYNKIVESFKLN